MKEKRIIIWDWDGVVVDSIDYKYLDIWEKIFPGETKKHKLVRDLVHTKEGRAMNRYDLIREALVSGGNESMKDLSGAALEAHPDMKEYADRYARGSVSGVIEKGLLLGVEKVIQKLFDDGYSMYVISTSKDDDLHTIADVLGMEKYFKKLLGFSRKLPDGTIGGFDKYESFKEVVEIENVESPDRYVVIGDGGSDYKLSKQIGCPFIAIATKWNEWANDPEMKPMLLEDIEGLPERLEELSE